MLLDGVNGHLPCQKAAREADVYAGACAVQQVATLRTATRGCVAAGIGRSGGASAGSVGAAGTCSSVAAGAGEARAAGGVEVLRRALCREQAGGRASPAR
jgi:hypothetical protein